MRHAFLLLLCVRFMGCAPSESVDVSYASEQDAEDAQFLVAGKADGASACQTENLLRALNGRVLTVEALKAGGVHTRAAKRLVAERAGEDEVVDTADDRYFADLEAVDAVKYVGPVAFKQLLRFAGAECAAQPAFEVIFSPQPYHTSHLARVSRIIDEAERPVVAAPAESSTGTIQPTNAFSFPGDLFDMSRKDAKKEVVDTFERLYVQALLERHDYNVTHAARAADMQRPNFKRLMNRVGVKVPRGDG